MSGRARDDGRVRIIGGHWRGRKLAVASVPALRPTPDRVRETLFNWLGPYIPGAACLDLFAGTGALGFEALSRGAAAATLLDADPVVVDTLAQHRETLAAEAATIIRADARYWLATNPPKPYDVVFVDPPFGQGLVIEITERLLAGWLAVSGMAVGSWMGKDVGNDSFYYGRRAPGRKEERARPVQLAGSADSPSRHDGVVL